jgi:hypothetical protein
MNSDGRVESEGEGLGSASPERGEKTREADVPGDSPSEDVVEELEEGPNDKVLARTFPSGCSLVFPHTSALLARFLLPFLPDALCTAFFVGWFFEDSLGEVNTVTMHKANTWTSPGAGVPVYSASFPPLNFSFFLRHATGTCTSPPPHRRLVPLVCSSPLYLLHFPSSPPAS